MFHTLVKRQFNLPRIRLLHSTSASKNKSIPSSQTSKPSTSEKVDTSILGAPMQIPSKFDKLLLVWVKRYPSMDQIPEKVSYECLKLAHTKARIRTCFIMAFLTIVGFLVSVVKGKQDVAAGKHMMSERLNWINEVKKKGEIEAEAARKS